MRERLADVELTYQRQTANAFMVTDAEDREVWLPKSQVEVDGRADQLVHGKVYEFTMPEWMAKQKELI
jgi:hypothetical protein